MAAGASTVDNLLNFNLEEGSRENNKENTHFAPNPDYHPGLPLPDFGEEDLEWLSDKDAFPSLDDYSYLDNILLETPSIPLNRHSPVSVLDTIKISNTNNINNGCGGPQPTTFPVRHPMKPRSNSHQRKRRTTFPTHQQLALLCQQNAIRKKQQHPLGRKCMHCQVEETPQWRAGPMGPKTLCNACGVRYKSGRLVPEYRPANSPTFSSSLHSNSHRKVVEMRKKKQLGGVEISEPCAHTRVA